MAEYKGTFNLPVAKRLFDVMMTHSALRTVLYGVMTAPANAHFGQIYVIRGRTRMNRAMAEFAIDSRAVGVQGMRKNYIVRGNLITGTIIYLKRRGACGEPNDKENKSAHDKNYFLLSKNEKSLANLI